MHAAATGRVRASLPPPPILVCAIVKIKSTQHFGLVLRQRPKWKTPLLQGGSHTTDNIECWTYYVHVQNNDALSDWYGASRLQVIHNEEDSDVAIARIRALPEVNPMRQNRVLVRVVDQDGHWVVDLMELPADAPHRKHVEKAWNHNALLDIQEDDEDEAGLHLFTEPESL